jgi:hypothetical protein
MGQIAMMRVKLGLSHDEIMNRPWILTQIECADFPYYDSKKKKYITNSFDYLEQLPKFKS